MVRDTYSVDHAKGSGPVVDLLPNLCHGSESTSHRYLTSYSSFSSGMSLKLKVGL